MNQRQNPSLTLGLLLFPGWSGGGGLQEEYKKIPLNRISTYRAQHSRAHRSVMEGSVFVLIPPPLLPLPKKLHGVCCGDNRQQRNSAGT